MSAPLAVESIRNLLLKINSAWLEGRTGELEQFFHPDMVTVSSDFQLRLKGRQGCIQSYDDFLTLAKIRNFKESDHVVDLWENTAVASYRYSMQYEIAGEVCLDTGRDTFVFSLQGDRWLAVWRTMFVDPKAPAGEPALEPPVNLSRE